MLNNIGNEAGQCEKRRKSEREKEEIIFFSVFNLRTAKFFYTVFPKYDTKNTKFIY